MEKNSVSKLIELAKLAQVTPEQKSEQRRSFVYGNTAFENRHISRELFEEQAAALNA